jgi:hypothetical protein
VSGRSGFGFGHADTPQRRISEKRIGRNPISHAAGPAIKQIGRDDFGIVASGVRESTAAVALTQRPVTPDIGAQHIVHHDKAVPIDSDSRAVKPEVICIGPAAGSYQQMRPLHRVAPGRILDGCGDPNSILFVANGSCSDVHRNALGRKMPCTAPEISGSSRPISRDPASTTVT